MKTAIGSQNSNEHFLPFSSNIQINNSQRDHQQFISAKKCAKSTKIISSLRYKQQTKWIHRHRHQTALSRKNLLLPVRLIVALS